MADGWAGGVYNSALHVPWYSRETEMAKTLSRTISGTASEEIAERVCKAAKIEDRTTSQIVVSAVDLYTRLPAEAHIALRRIELLGGPGEMERAIVAFGRDILRYQFDAARDSVAASMSKSMQIGGLAGLESDSDFLSAASAAVARATARTGRRSGARIGR